MTGEGVGERLRAARLARGLSLRSVALELGVSASLISQVENGKTQPSVATLYAIVQHLGISFDDLLGTESTLPSGSRAIPSRPSQSTVFQSGAENPVLEMENGVRWERLATGATSPTDAMLVTYAPGASSSIEGKLMRHAGIELGYLLEGSLSVQVDFDTFDLAPGDSLQFDSVRPHLYINRGTVPARGLWVVVGRREEAAAMPDAPDDADAASSRGVSSAVDVLRYFDPGSVSTPS